MTLRIADMARVTFILGGARSGKSKYALELAKNNGRKVIFIATASPQDKEMEKRIRLHKKSRPAHWQTLENPKDIAESLKKIGAEYDIILIDCLTLIVSNFMLDGLKENAIRNKIAAMLNSAKRNKAQVIIVSNEVGLGIVPENKLARDFRDIAGRVNQIVAAKSDEAYFMVSGMPLRLK